VRERRLEVEATFGLGLDNLFCKASQLHLRSAVQRDELNID
jgi:hypothetical protein